MVGVVFDGKRGGFTVNCTMKCKTLVKQRGKDLNGKCNDDIYPKLECLIYIHDYLCSCIYKTTFEEESIRLASHTHEGTHRNTARSCEHDHVTRRATEHPPPDFIAGSLPHPRVRRAENHSASVKG